ncbi:MAG: GlsB/YeaQ/YmgE family stress response membrane protein [Pirellulaceae bacterium]
MTSNLEEMSGVLLMWVGFGTLTGLLAKAVVPGKDEGNTIITLAMGIGGSILGCGVMTMFSGGERVSPVSTGGFIAAILGTFAVLVLYRMMTGQPLNSDLGSMQSRRLRLYNRRREHRAGTYRDAY